MSSLKSFNVDHSAAMPNKVSTEIARTLKGSRLLPGAHHPGGTEAMVDVNAIRSAPQLELSACLAPVGTRSHEQGEASSRGGGVKSDLAGCFQATPTGRSRYQVLGLAGGLGAGQSAPRKQGFSSWPIGCRRAPCAILGRPNAPVPSRHLSGPVGDSPQAHGLGQSRV